MNQNISNNFKELEALIDNFPKQFSWQPKIINKENLPSTSEKIAICGMGGSALAANVLLSNPKAPNIRIHRDYWHNWLADMDLVIISSYSGNTEEMVDVYQQAKIAGVPIAVSASGGELIDLAARDNNPYIILADAPQPRYAIGYSYLALSKFANTPISSTATDEISNISADKKKYYELAKRVAGKQIVFYSTPKNISISYVWKILTNESAKQLAWINKFPEFNHNELNGYFTSENFNLSNNLAVVIITSNNEHPRNQRRIEIISQQLRDRDIEVIEINLVGENLLERVIYGWQAGMYFTLELAKQNQVDPKEVKIIEDLKQKLAK